MTVRLTKPSRLQRFGPWLDALAVLAWGILLLKYWLTGKLNILIHPNYFGLTVAGGIGLIVLGSFKVYELWQQFYRQPTARRRGTVDALRKDEVQHITFFPPGWGSTLLLLVAVLGLLITPRTFASQTALERGITESLPMTRLQPQEFRNLSKPEERSLIEWVRLLNFNPEPDTYKGQKVKVQGFIVHPPSLSDQYIWMGRFIITCCAADAYPVGLPVKLPEGQSRAAFPPDKWLEVEGQMITDELEGKRKLTILASSLKLIPEPKNPYDY